MKKVFNFIKYFTCLLFLVFLSSCTKTKGYNSLKIMSINDLHGAIEISDDNYGMPGIAGLVKEERKKEEQAVLVLAAGDMFQGTAISNYSYGQTVVELMNYVGFDAMTIGNHEFDWGLEEVLKYVDNEDQNGEADFPFLACNLIQKDTNQRPNYVEPYEIIDFDTFQVGVIGYIGYGIESDISASKVENYYFDDPMGYISSYAKELRSDKGCELVIVMGHDDNSAIQNKIANLKNEEAIDMIISAHTHATYVRYLENGNDEMIPITQAGSSADSITSTVFDFNKDENKFTHIDSKNISLGSYDIPIDPKAESLVDEMNEEIEPIMGEVIGIAGKYVNKTSVGQWTASAIHKQFDCDVAAINSGGIRSYAFPVNEDSSITIKKIYEIMPFDNFIKICELKGNELIQVLKITDIYLSDNVSYISGIYYIDGEAIDVNKIYKFACVDYLYDRDEIIYENGENVIFTGTLIRDVMINQIRIESSLNNKWLDE